ncbi:MAG: nitrate reductase subunit beta, partial [Candidatus Thioglobus sp.]|nr:nitrate reductase subunit beta [Candidatus Thioglobus sp.]
ACAESCVGRIRYVGVMLYDADKIGDSAATPNETDLYQEHLDVFMDPNDPKVIKQALEDGIPQSWIDAAQNSPVYKMVMDWKIAFPIHPEYRTLPMMWYVPPLSPVQSQIDKGNVETSNGIIPTVDAMRFPAKYLANMFTAGDEKPIISSMSKLLAMRAHQRFKAVDGTDGKQVLADAGLSVEQAEDMYQMLGIANYEDRFVIPTSHEEMRHEDPYGFQGQNGFSGGNVSSHGSDGGKGFSLFPSPRKKSVIPVENMPKHKS